jgi:hypothetical protein
LLADERVSDSLSTRAFTCFIASVPRRSTILLLTEISAASYLCELHTLFLSDRHRISYRISLASAARVRHCRASTQQKKSQNQKTKAEHVISCCSNRSPHRTNHSACIRFPAQHSTQPTISRRIIVTQTARAMMRPRSVGVIRLPDLAVGGRIMKLMTREQLFAAPKLARRAKARFDRGMVAVSAARIRAMEIAKQCAELPRLPPTASHRRRLVRLRGP